ncbi:MAG TPA: VOC family protein [Candidatus Baltobacteraceae bacterium]
MNNVNLIIYPAADVAKAKAFYTTLLGTQPYADSPYYVGFKAGETEIGLVQKKPGMDGALAYVNVDDINAALAALVAAGAEKVQDPTDVAQGLLVATVKNLDGTPVGLRQFPKS